MFKKILTFPFFNELTQLNILLNELYDVIDQFILIEMCKTHTNQSKPYFFAENKHLFNKFLDKIHHIQIDENILNNVNTHTWNLENFQRDYATLFWGHLNDDDIIISVDADEIPRREVIEKLNVRDDIVYALRIYQHQLYLNYRGFNCLEDEILGKVLTLGHFKRLNIRLSELRYFPICSVIENAGWHFSFLGIDSVEYKFKSYAHAEHNKEENYNKKILEQRMAENKDIYGNNKDFHFISIDNTYPTYVLDNIEQLRHLIY